MTIERLRLGEEARLRTIRLRSLRDAPDAFGSTAHEVASRPPESWTEQLSNLPTFVAVVDGRDVGIVRFSPDAEIRETGWLISMWVSPDARGTGVGSALIDAVVEFATSAGIARLELDVGDHNAPAIALYASKGFDPTGEASNLDSPRQHIREHRRVFELA